MAADLPRLPRRIPGRDEGPAPILGSWSLLLGLAGVVEAAVLLLIIRRRYLRQHRILTRSRGPAPIASGRLAAGLALSTGAAGVLSLVAVLCTRH